MTVEIGTVPTKNTEPVICSGCSKNMRDPVSGTSIVGICLSCDTKPIPNTMFPPLSEPFIREQFGIFAPPPGVDTVVYQFCYECWLKSLMPEGKPLIIPKE